MINYPVKKNIENVLNALELLKEHQNKLLFKIKILLFIVSVLLFANYDLTLLSYSTISSAEVLLSYLVYPLALLSALVLILTIIPFVVFPSDIIDLVELIILGKRTYNAAVHEYSIKISSRFLLSLILSEVLSSLLLFLFYVRETFVVQLQYTLIDFFLAHIPFLSALLLFLIIYVYREKIFTLIANSYLNIYLWDAGKIDIRNPDTYP